MNWHDIDVLKIYVWSSPLLVFGLALGVYWLTGWMERRGQSHRAAE